MDISDPDHPPTVPGAGQSWWDGEWKWVPPHCEPTGNDPGFCGGHWQWVRGDDKPCSVHDGHVLTPEELQGNGGCMIFIAVGLAGLGGGVLSLFA